MAKKKQSAGLLTLTVPQRIALAQDLWDSVAAEHESVPLTDDERDLIDERLRAYDADPSGALPWERVRENLLKEFAPVRRAVRR